MKKKQQPSKMRVARFVALNTDYSRRTAETLINKGRISVNNKTAKIGQNINPEKDRIEVNGELIKPLEKRITIMLNKPAGYITTKKDPHAKKTVMDLIPYTDLFPIGRLDKDTEGLLLLTNDGDLAYKLTHPKFEHEKEYLVELKQQISREQIQKLEKGIILNSKKTAPCKITNHKENKLNITLHEGRKRQIKRMFEYLGNKVIYLYRLRIGKLKLGNLKKGTYKIIKDTTDIC
ncbi:pseudouridine synthase [Patescibacteria group bacterium]